MKVYDAKDVIKPDDVEYVRMYGYWVEDVNWKGLRIEGYTHVLVHDKLYTMGKYGPKEEVCV